MNTTYVLSGPKFDHPVKKITLGHFFFNNAQKHHNKICQIDGTSNKSETFASVRTRSTRLAIAMQSRGTTSKDNVIICSSNTLDNTIPILSSLYLGSKVANLDGSISVQHTKHLLDLVRPKMIFVEEASLELIEQGLEGSDFSVEIVVFGRSEKYCSFPDLIQPQDNEDGFRPVEGHHDDVAVMFFSSGTTGLPKAICHSHYSFLSVVQQVGETGTEKSSLHFSSFYWITAMLMLTTCFKSGNYRVFCCNPSAEEVFRIIETYKVEYVFLAPILTYMLTSYQSTKQYDCSSVKLIRCAGTPMAPTQIRKMKELFKNSFITLVYAQSEAGLAACFDFRCHTELAERKMPLGSCGKVAPEVQLKVSDLNTKESLGVHQKGEICLKSQCVMKGYYQADASLVFDDDNFLKTGDVGYYDEDGCVYIIERVKEIFKYQSWHIVPSLIERVLLELPVIKEVVVVGVPCGEDGDVPAAAIVLKDNCSLNENEIDEFLKKKVADRERLRGGVVFVDELRRTPTGKIARKEIRSCVVSLLKRS